MAKKKKNNGSGLLVGILVGCILSVAVAAVAKNMLNTSGDPAGDSSLQGSVSNTGSDLPVTDPTTDTSLPSSDTETDTTPVTDTETSDTTSSTQTQTSSQTQSQTSTGGETSNREEYVSANDTASFSKDAWYMLLANPDHALPENYTFEQAKVYSAGQYWIMDARCAEDMKAMLAAAKADGVDLMICSAYRSVELQTQLFNNRVQEYINKGYSAEKAREIAATINAVPGTSEHHTGMAADIVTPSYQRLNAGFDQTAAYKWLEANCAEFGFVLRYRKDKTDITRIIYEPWHYRYVGKEAATIMMNEGICFEEFLEKYGT